MVFLKYRQQPAAGDNGKCFQQGICPASVDMGGTLIIPLEKDFHKITRNDIADIFSQVSLSVPEFDKLVKHMEKLAT